MRFFLWFEIILFSLLSFRSEILAFATNNASLWANSIKTILRAVDRPARLTGMVCWSSDFSFQFYKSFSVRNNRQLSSKDFVLVISTVNYHFLPNTPREEHQEFVFLDSNCDNFTDVLFHAQERLVNYGWIILNDKENETEADILSTLDYLPALPKSEIYYLYRHTATQSIHIQQIYRAGTMAPLTIEWFGIIANNQFYDYRNTKITSRRRQNLHGVTLRASMVVTNNETLTHLTDYREIQTDPITKVNYVLTGFLMSYLNATINYSVVSSWGYKNDETGEWSGMVGQLIRNEAELGLSPLFMTVERIPLIQYIAMPTPTGSRFVFRSPKLSYTDNVFLLPFDSFVWYCLMILVMITALCLMCAIFAEWKYALSNFDKKACESNSSMLRPSICDIFLVIFGATCQQGSAVTPRSIASRIIMIVAFTILMFLYTSYSANIVALLQSPSTRIKTLKDLYESRLEIGVDDTVFNRYFFSHAVEPIRKKIYDQKVLKKNGQDNFMTLEQGVQRVRKGLFAFHMELALGYKLMSETFFEDEKCGIIEIAYLQVTDPWYAIQKNSSYKELFKIGMMRMHEHGLQDRENSRMYTKKPRCSGTAGNFITASLVDTKPALLVLLWGCLFSICLLMLELLTNRIHHIKFRELNAN